MSKIFAILAAAGIVAAAAAAPASAQQFPASVVGGPWKWNANQGGVLVTITSQMASGFCNPIAGMMQAEGGATVDNLQGYYCPTTGALAMLRMNATSGITYQVWTGQVDSVPTLAQAYAAGSFASLGTGNSAGAFFFSGDLFQR